MKKFYTLALMSAFAVSSACAFTTIQSSLQEVKAPRMVENLNAKFNTRKEVKKINYTKVMSRADEATAVESAQYIQYYNDYFDLYYGNEKALKNAIVEVAQEGDGYVIKNLFGYEGWNVNAYVDTAKDEDGESVTLLVVPAGQKLDYIESRGWDIVLWGYNEETDNIDGDGEIAFIVAEDGLMPTSYYFGGYVIDAKTGEGQGFYELAYYNAFVTPNSTYTANVYNVDGNLNVESVDPIEYPMYWEMYVETDDSNKPVTNPDGSYNYLIDITSPIVSKFANNAYIVTFNFYPKDSSVEAVDQMLDGSYGTADGGETGEFVMFSYDAEAQDLSNNPVLGSVKFNDADEFESMVFGDFFPYTLQGYWFACYIGDNKVVAGFGQGENGINSVANDNVNAPVEYYNIQGMKVANPVKGNLYIVKKGNEVSKTIVR